MTEEKIPEGTLPDEAGQAPDEETDDTEAVEPTPEEAE